MVINKLRKGIAEEAMGMLDSFSAVLVIKAVLFYALRNALFILSDNRSARARSRYRGNNFITGSKQGK